MPQPGTNDKEEGKRGAEEDRDRRKERRKSQLKSANAFGSLLRLDLRRAEAPLPNLDLKTYLGPSALQESHLSAMHR